MSPKPYITPALFRFLEELKGNNNRDWFEANKERYEAQLREPLLRFIDDFKLPLQEISSNFVASSRKVGGSLFRIYRDVRFSKDKSPYKTAAGIQFRHKAGKDVHAPGFYLHLEPGNVFVGMGIWRPDASSLQRIRSSIVRSPDRWEAAISDSVFSQHFKLGGESLKRAPKGFDPEHPLIEDLKRKDYVAFCQLDEAASCEDDFVNQVAGYCRKGEPFMRFLTSSLELPW